MTTNEARIAEFLKAEPDMARTMWMAALADNRLLGFLSATIITPREARVQVLVPKEHWKDKPLVKAMREGAEGFFLGPLIKLTMSFPLEWAESLSLAARLGFQREGLNKASFVKDDGTVVDQLYLGRAKHVEAEVGHHRDATVPDSVAGRPAGDPAGPGVPRHPDVPA